MALSEEQYQTAERKALLHNILHSEVETVIKTVFSEKLGKDKDEITLNNFKAIEKLPQKDIALKNCSCFRKTWREITDKLLYPLKCWETWIESESSVLHIVLSADADSF